MELSIPKDKAIKILRDRLAEIDYFGFNPKAWKNSTENDLREIFYLGSQWLQVSSINFETFITAEQPKILNEGKDTARKLIASYIKFIEEYSQVQEEKQIINEQDFEKKYNALVVDWNDLVPNYNALGKKYDAQLAINEGLTKDIETKEQEIERIKTETIQLDNVSVKKLWKAITNLKAGQLFGIVSTFIALLFGAYSLGTLVEGTSAKNESFELKSSNKEYQLKYDKLKSQYDSLQLAKTIKIDTTTKHK